MTTPPQTDDHNDNDNDNDNDDDDDDAHSVALHKYTRLAQKAGDMPSATNDDDDDDGTRNSKSILNEKRSMITIFILF